MTFLTSFIETGRTMYTILQVSSWASLHEVTEDDLNGDEDVTDCADWVPIGRSMLDTRVEVWDEHGRPVEPGGLGTIWIGKLDM